MTVLELASAGDELAFRELTEPFRRELEFRCYRMSSAALEVLRTCCTGTLLPRWRGWAGFERRSSLRTWLCRSNEPMSERTAGCPSPPALGIAADV